MDHKEKADNPLSGKSVADLIGEVFGLEQAEVRESLNDLMKVFKRLDAHNRKNGKPASHERDFRDLKNFFIEKKEKKMRGKEKMRVKEYRGGIVLDFDDTLKGVEIKIWQTASGPDLEGTGRYYAQANRPLSREEGLAIKKQLLGLRELGYSETWATPMVILNPGFGYNSGYHSEMV